MAVEKAQEQVVQLWRSWLVGEAILRCGPPADGLIAVPVENGSMREITSNNYESTLTLCIMLIT
jgi:hypothetical protein